MYAQMLVHAIVHESCTDTVRESALEIDSGKKKKEEEGKKINKKKSLAASKTRTRVSIAPVFLFLFWLKALPVELSPPLSKTTEHLLCRHRQARPLHGDNPRGQF